MEGFVSYIFKSITLILGKNTKLRLVIILVRQKSNGVVHAAATPPDTAPQSILFIGVSKNIEDFLNQIKKP